MSASQPSRFAPSSSQLRPIKNLFSSHSWTAMKRQSCSVFTQKRCSAWPAIVRFTEPRLGSYGGSVPPIWRFG